MTIHERNNVQTAKLKLKIAKLELTVSELTETNNCYERLNDRLTAMLDDATERISRLQEIIDDHETQYENFVERFATMQTPETEVQFFTETPKPSKQHTIHGITNSTNELNETEPPELDLGEALQRAEDYPKLQLELETMKREIRRLEGIEKQYNEVMYCLQDQEPALASWLQSQIETTPETETTDDLILSPKETESIDPNQVW